MYRLKLTTIKDKVFLSPFIYTKEQAERRLKKLKWLVKELKNQGGKVLKSGKLEMILVEVWPDKAEYNYNKVTDLTFLGILERRWEEYDSIQENID